MSFHLLRALILTSALIGVGALSAVEIAAQEAPATGEAPDQGVDSSGVENSAESEDLVHINFFAEIRDAVIRYTGEGGWITWIQVFAIVFLALLIDFAQRKILSRLKSRLASTKNPWDDAFLDALRTPLSLVIWVFGIALAASLVELETWFVKEIIILTIIASVAWFLVRLIKNAEANLEEMSQSAEAEEDRWDPSTIQAMGKLVRLSIVITAVLIGLDQIGVNISAVLAFGGIGGIAVGFAAKDLLANFFGGLMIYLDRPFKVGDWVRSPDREIEGTVEYIGWRLTRIRTFDKRPLFIPNSIFNTIAVENPGRMLNRRIYETIGIRYDDMAQMDAITKEVTSMLQNHAEIDTSQMLMVYFNAFGPSSVDFFVYTFTKTTDWKYYHQIKHEILTKISDIIDAHGAQIAFPTSTLHVASWAEKALPSSEIKSN